VPAYIIADVEWCEPDKIEEYSILAYPTLVAAGGKMLAATSQPEVIEGEWRPGIVVLIEFPSADDARRWLDSPDYRPAREVRHQSANTNLILIDSESN
jgi:uncharacterized protein (DUF1330 family)